MTKQELQEDAVQLRTMYKHKDKKIRPANLPLLEGVNPRGTVDSEPQQGGRRMHPV